MFHVCCRKDGFKLSGFPEYDYPYYTAHGGLEVKLGEKLTTTDPHGLACYKDIATALHACWGDVLCEVEAENIRPNPRFKLDGVYECDARTVKKMYLIDWSQILKDYNISLSHLIQDIFDPLYLDITDEPFFVGPNERFEKYLEAI